jgi:hypothetical protein
VVKIKSATYYITQILPKVAGMSMTIISAVDGNGVREIGDGGNINLKTGGILYLNQNDTLTVVCDGTYWYEVSRSDN